MYAAAHLVGLSSKLDPHSFCTDGYTTSVVYSAYTDFNESQSDNSQVCGYSH